TSRSPRGATGAGGWSSPPGRSTSRRRSSLPTESPTQPGERPGRRPARRSRSSPCPRAARTPCRSRASTFRSATAPDGRAVACGLSGAVTTRRQHADELIGGAPRASPDRTVLDGGDGVGGRHGGVVIARRLGDRFAGGATAVAGAPLARTRVVRRPRDGLLSL